MAFTVRQGVELFHLAFLAELGTKLDRSLYAVKGGCNLRFFFRSIRYSEDLDIDVETTNVSTLRRKVDKLLSSTSLARTLGSRAIVAPAWSAPKQTETTQRWKVALSIDGVDAHTKIEFSRRGLGQGAEFGVVDAEVTAQYGLTRTMVSHYGRHAALQQKVRALIGRSQTQARDVFDLELLCSGGEADLSGLAAATCKAAQERALSVDFDMFRAQVLAYLPVDQQHQYDSPQVWDELVERVVDGLGARGEA